MVLATTARWIWSPGETLPRNGWRRFRTTFSSPDGLAQATLALTADSRYDVWINGHWIGYGPMRGYPWAYTYDLYDITSWLHPNAENTIAVRVVQWGDHTFQSLTNRAGLLCSLELHTTHGDTTSIVTDEQWQVCIDPSIVSNTPRISVQQGYVEEIDARADRPWLLHDAPGPWEHVVVLDELTQSPWETLTPRSVPSLTRDPVAPVRILAQELALLPTSTIWSFDWRRKVVPPDHGWQAEPAQTRGRAFATEIVTSTSCQVRLTTINAGYEPVRYSIRGQELMLPCVVDLPAGRSLLVATGTDWLSLAFITDQHLIFDAAPLNDGAEAAWAYLGPFPDSKTSTILSATHPLDLSAETRQPVYASDNLSDSVLAYATQSYALPSNGWTDHSIDGPQPRVRLQEIAPLFEHTSHLLHVNSEYTTIHPHPSGDAHLVIDFGREIIGYITLEIDAPQDTLIDIVAFEGIDESGIYWPENLRNGLRYTCRAGYQRYTSHQRRGFRYLSLTLRQHQTPVKLYHVGCLLSTYPVEKQGSFACSDMHLTRIWEVACDTAQLCMEDTYTDCPMYEQTAWVGDARISALTNAVAFGGYDLTDRQLEVTGQSLTDDIKSIMPPSIRVRPHLTAALAVSGWFVEIPMWSFLWVWNVWEQYQITGDHDRLAARYAEVAVLLARCQNFLTDRGLLNVPDVWNLVDWAAMDLTREGEVTANSALLAASFTIAARMADALQAHAPQIGLQQSAAHYRAQATSLQEAINRWCWDETRGAYVDTLRDDASYQRYLQWCETQSITPLSADAYAQQTKISEPTNTLVYLCDCTTSERRERIWPLILAAQDGHFVASSPDHASEWPADQVVPVGSPWFLFFTLEALVKAGARDTALRIIREQWGMMLAKGATTFWETFLGSIEGHWSRSLCHGWSSAPAYFLSTLVLGITPVAQGTLTMHPYFGTLQWASGHVPTVHGPVFVHWERQDTTITLHISVPHKLTIQIELDEGYNWAPGAKTDTDQPSARLVTAGNHTFVLHNHIITR